MPVGLGQAIGEGPDTPDRVNQLTNLNERRQQYIEAGKAKKAAAAEKDKENQYNKDYAAILNLDKGKFSHLVHGAVDETAQDAASDLTNIYYDSRTPEDFTRDGAQRILKLRSDLTGLQQTAENYDKYATTPDNQLTYWGGEAKKAANQNDMEGAKEVMTHAIPNPFGAIFDPDSGRIAPPVVVRDKTDVEKDFQTTAKSGADVFTQYAGKTKILGTQYEKYLNTLPETNEEALRAAKALGIPPNPDGSSPLPSVDTLTNQYIQTHPSAQDNWLHSQFPSGADDETIKAMTEKYFTHDLQDPNNPLSGLKPNTEVVSQDFKQYVSNGIRGAQQIKEKDLSGRPESSSTYGGAGYEEKEDDKIYQETQASSQANLQAAKDAAAASKTNLDELKTKRSLKKGQLKQAEDDYKNKQAAAQKREKENDNIKTYKAQLDAGEITSNIYRRKIQAYNPIELKGDESASDLIEGRSYTRNGITQIWDGTKFIKP